jgi:hypothetical protein
MLSRSCRHSVALLGLIASSAFATTTTVNSIADLQTAINTAIGGDTIIVQGGTYTTSGSISINRVGTSSSPITIKSSSVGGAIIAGSAGFKFVSPAAYITVDGFVFNHAGSISIPSGTNHIKLTRNIIELSIPTGSDVSYLNISGDDVEIDHNELRNKSTLGEMLDIAGSGSQVARRLWVHHNYFHDFKSPGGNGAETIRWGLSGLSLSTGDGLCEYNLFVRCTGENELISNKSSGNTYRYNTFLDSPGAQMSQRHGNFNLIYGNYFRNTDGIRIYGDNNQVFNNYLEGNSAGIDIGNGDGEVESGAALTSHDKPDNTTIVFNTLINNTKQFFMEGRTGGLGAVNTTFANNIIQGGGTAASISSSAPYTGAVWAGNIVWNTTAGNMPAGTYTVVDPKLVADGNGVFHISATSPAIGASVGSYPSITTDMDGQTRDSFKDIGADEFSSGQITAKLLTTADVGTGAGGGSSGGTAPSLNFEAENLVFTTSGASGTITFEDTASGGQFASPHITDPTDPLYPQRHRYVTLNADGNPPTPTGEWIEFTLPSVPHGTYNLVLRYKTHPTNRGIMRMFVDGVVQGADLNQLATATFTTKDFGVVRFATDGTHVIRMAVVGKSNLVAAPTSPWNITADLFTLVPDTTKPVFTSFPTDKTLEATGPDGAVATYTGTATDNKDGAVPVIFSPASGSVFPLGDSLVVGTAQDFAGNIAVASFNISVVDTTAPTFGALSDVTAEATSAAGANVVLSATAHDLVDGTIDATLAPGSGTLFPIGTTTVTATAGDQAGNSATSTFNVIVRDTTPPTLTLPAALVIEATSPAGALATFHPTASDLVSGSETVICTPASGSTFPLGTTTVTASAQDAIGNTATGSFTVTVRDTTSPVLTLPPDLVLEATGPGGAVAIFTGSASDLVSGAVAVTFSQTSGTTFPLGTTIVNATAQDAAGNIATGKFSVTVRDTTAPALTVPANIVVEATGSNGAVATFNAAATDLVNGNVPVNFSQASGTVFPLGTTVVTVSAADAAGNVASGTFTVTVRDTTPPVLTLPANLVLEATSPAGAMATFAPTAYDLVSGNVAVTCSPASGSTFALGTTTVNAAAQDAVGNTATGSFTVTVRDTTPPTISSVTASPSTLGPVNHKMIPVSLVPAVQDAADSAPHSRIVSVTSNEPINGPGDGNTAPDFEITGDLTVNLRAERSGSGTGRIYTITIESRDASNNVSTATVNVVVPHDGRK